VATFTTACENILVNGHSPSPALVASLLDASPTEPVAGTEEYEPVNSKQHSRAVDLAQREEALLLEIIALKREAPASALDARRGAQKADLERDEDELKRALEALDVPPDSVLALGKRERQDEVEKTWERGVQGLARLKAGMPGTTARMERARRAAEYVLAEGKESKR
jgi:kinetochor protein Mis14/NSL1